MGVSAIGGFAVGVVDTVGCGDAFMASLLAGLLAADLDNLERAAVREVGARASAAGAVLATRAGAMTRMPTRGRNRPTDRGPRHGGDMKEERLLRIGVLGAGQIAQAAHFESCVKARNAELYAICDVAEDLRERMAVAHGARRTFADYDAMLADPDVEAVIIATADAFHVDASIKALEAGKHVLCEKPMATSVEDAERLRDAVGEERARAPCRPHEAL